jgi:hypothetical protein
MAKKKRQFFIDEKKAIELFESGYSFKIQRMNWYQLRISHEETDTFWDWYHTQGSTVINKNGTCARWGMYGDAEKLAIAIKEYIYQE